MVVWTNMPMPRCHPCSQHIESCAAEIAHVEGWPMTTIEAESGQVGGNSLRTTMELTSDRDSCASRSGVLARRVDQGPWSDDRP